MRSARTADAPGRSAGGKIEPRGRQQTCKQQMPSSQRDGFEPRTGVVVARIADALAGQQEVRTTQTKRSWPAVDAPGRSAGVGFEPRTDHAVVACTATPPWQVSR